MGRAAFDWPGRRPGNAAHDRVAALLLLDIQRDRASAAELAARIEAVRTGALSAWDRVGNAHHLQLSPAGAVIADVVDEASEPERVSLEELAAAAAAWLASLP